MGSGLTYYPILGSGNRVSFWFWFHPGQSVRLLAGDFYVQNLFCSIKIVSEIRNRIIEAAPSLILNIISEPHGVGVQTETVGFLLFGI